MVKVVINKCRGGFGLSAAAVLNLFDRQSELVSCYTFEEYKFNMSEHYLAEMTPFEGRPGWYHDKFNVVYDTNDQKIYVVGYYSGKGLNGMYSYHDIAFRVHPDLIDVVETLGDDANGNFAQLKVVEIPEYDDISNLELTQNGGYETVREISRSWD